MPDIRDEARAGFRVLTGHDASGVWSAPGTVPTPDGMIAGSRRVVIALGLRDDRYVRIANAETDELVELDLAELDIARALGADLEAVPGFDLLVDSDVPDALDPSAALEAALAMALNDVWRLGHDSASLAVLVPRPAAILGGIELDGLLLVMDGGESPDADMALAADTATGVGARRTWVEGGVVLALIDEGDLSLMLVSLDGAFAEHGLPQPDTYAVSAGYGARREPG